MTDTRRAALIRGREWFNNRLSELFRYRTECRGLFRTAKAVDDLEHAVGAAASLLDLEDKTAASVLGGFSAGKTTILSLFLPSPLPSDRMPTSRVFTLIEPIDGLTTTEYYVAELGQTGARRLLRCIAEYLGPLAEDARKALEVDGDVRAAAAALGEYVLKNYDAIRTGKARLIAMGAAFLCRSIREFVGGAESTTVHRLTDGGFTAAEQARHHVAWDKRIPFLVDEEPNGNVLRTRLDELFRSEPLNRLRLNAEDEADLPALREIYRIGLRLGVIGYLKLRVPASDTFRAGHLYADAPGRGGANLLDTVMGDLVLQSAAAGVLVVNSMLPGGIEQRALVAELRNKSTGVIFNYSDQRLSGEKVAEAVRRLGADTAEAEFVANTRTVMAEFASADILDLYNPASPYRELLGGSPTQASKVVLAFAEFDKMRNVRELCSNLTHLAAWLAGDEAVAGDLPPHVRRLVEKLPKRPLSAPLSALDRDLSPRVIARLVGLLVQLGADGGKCGVGPLFQAVEGDSVRARYRQWQVCSGDITKALAAVVLPAPGPDRAGGSEHNLPRPQRQAIQAIRNRVERAVEATVVGLERGLRIDHLYGPIEGPAESGLNELCERAADGLAGAALGSAREGAVHRFRLVIDRLPEKLDLEFDAALQAYTARVKGLLDEIWVPVLDHNGYPDEPTKKLFAAAAGGLAVHDPAADVDALRDHLHDAFRAYWTDPLTSASPMESIQDERYDPSRHPARFRAIALRVGRHRAATALIQAGRAVLARTRATVNDWLTDVKNRFDRSTLLALARVEDETDPALIALRRQKQARANLAVLQREYPDVLAAVDAALAPPGAPKA